ncbi:MAG TPA: peptide chain release factor N(5)-glutamine methyltransferase [Stellaceae bacterium]|nr:peptide chain release factor N(5)-glutamine methyltransferase [Stellaceae bacterium]
MSAAGPPKSAGEAVARAAAALAAAGVAEPRREARLIVALALAVEPGVVLGYPERVLDLGAAARLETLVARRQAREPFSRLYGRRPFWTLDLALSPETLDPRPDSETLVEAVLAAIPDRRTPLRLLDLGTGTGCLLLALLSELPKAVGFGIDILGGAAAVARRNAAANGLGDRAFFLVGDWAQAIGVGAADVVVANPPYISTGEIDRLAPEVARHEPRRALDGGSDGLDAYRVLAGELPRMLARGGMAAVELGAGQREPVARLMHAGGLAIQAVRCDLSGVQRVLLMTRQ